MKKTGSETPRPITDCSRPFARSLNSYIGNAPFKFEGIDDVLLQSSFGSHYAIVDIKAVYRHVPVYPPHRQLQSFRWQFTGEPERYFIDNFLCFGLSNGPEIFHRISSVIARKVRFYGYKIVSNLDDFLVICQTAEEGRKVQSCLIRLLVRLGFSIKWEKVTGPTTRIQFLGLIIDSIKQRLELPREKMQALNLLCRLMKKKEKVTKHELQKLVGHMSFAGKAMYGGGTFTRISIDELSSLNCASHRTRRTGASYSKFSGWNLTSICILQLSH